MTGFESQAARGRSLEEVSVYLAMSLRSSRPSPFGSKIFTYEREDPFRTTLMDGYHSPGCYHGDDREESLSPC